MNRVTTIERAYQLAASGECRTIEEIAKRLKQEQMESVEAHLGGTGIRKDLRQIVAQSRTARAARAAENDGTAEAAE